MPSKAPAGSSPASVVLDECALVDFDLLPDFHRDDVDVVEGARGIVLIVVRPAEGDA